MVSIRGTENSMPTLGARPNLCLHFVVLPSQLSSRASIEPYDEERDS